MKFRKLRIAWSVLWGIACVLLIVLWVRSYWHGDQIEVPRFSRSGFMVESVLGRLSVNYRDDDHSITEWEYASFECSPSDAGEIDPAFGFDPWNEVAPYISSPHWFPALVFGLIAAAPWLHYHFSLRTLLIATMLVAVVLGLIVAVL